MFSYTIFGMHFIVKFRNNSFIFNNGDDVIVAYCCDLNVAASHVLLFLSKKHDLFDLKTRCYLEGECCKHGVSLSIIKGSKEEPCYMTRH